MASDNDDLTAEEPPVATSVVPLYDSTLLAIARQSRFLIAELRRPHRVLSTSMHGGGLREDCQFIVNHQSCEPVGDDAAMALFRERGIIGYHQLACQQAKLPAHRTVLCGTAANMKCASLVQFGHEELVVTAITTAGVEGNATRAGDHAGWHETQGGCTRVPPYSGTIVNLVFINQPCTSGCLVKAASMLTEAKTTALLDLRIPSRQSHKLATGTGTDQFTIACPLGEERDWERHYSGSHNTLGQVLCEAVHRSTTKALQKQNGLVPSLRASVLIALERHGCTRALLEETARKELPPVEGELFVKNLTGLVHDPATAATAYAIAELLDIADAQFVTSDILIETLLNQCTLLATTVATSPAHFARLRSELATSASQTPSALVCRAIALGFGEKWKTRVATAESANGDIVARFTKSENVTAS